jgi:hypothetical protein
MRTTVTLDADTEQLLRQAMQQTGQGFKSMLNQAIRKGLADVVPVPDEPPFVVEAQDMGWRPGIDPTKLQELADDLELEAFLNLNKRLEEERKVSGL